jgi:retron-type reverse transcriptase
MAILEKWKRRTRGIQKEYKRNEREQEEKWRKEKVPQTDHPSQELASLFIYQLSLILVFVLFFFFFSLRA